MFRIAILVITLVLPGWGFGQSLGDVARKERERRDKNRTEGVPSREFSEGEIFDDEDEEAREPADAETDVAVDGAPEADGPVPERIDVDVRPIESDESEASTEDEARERRRKEAEFRSRYRAAKERLLAARERKAALDSIRYVDGVEYVDENGDVALESLDHLRRLVSEAAVELADAEQAVKALEEQARRRGYPPGWLR